jgi:hypothetical protein
MVPMTEQRPDPIPEPVPAAEPEPRRPSQRPSRTAIAWLILLLLLGAATLIAPGDRSNILALANPDLAGVSELRGVFDSLPDQPLVVVGMDADLGTYPEIRPATRAAFDDLLARGASLAFVSVTGEGRAIAAAEVERLQTHGVSADVLLDMGYVAGTEAGLVRLVGSTVPATSVGSLADGVRSRGGGLDAFDLALLVGGSDVGPRTWVEQVGPRLPDLPMVAIAPTFAQPELAPYLRSGQLSALIATVRDGAAYSDAVDPDAEGDAPPSALAMLAGMIVAALLLVRQLLGVLPLVGRPAAREALDGDQP